MINTAAARTNYHNYLPVLATGSSVPVTIELWAYIWNKIINLPQIYQIQQTKFIENFDFIFFCCFQIMWHPVTKSASGRGCEVCMHLPSLTLWLVDQTYHQTWTWRKCGTVDSQDAPPWCPRHRPPILCTRERKNLCWCHFVPSLKLFSSG